MRYTAVDSTEYTYPDVQEYTSSSGKIKIDVARGGYATAQIMLFDVPTNIKLDISADIEGIEWYELFPVVVDQNPKIDEDKMCEHYPERKAPYLVNDCLKPLSDKVTVTDGATGLYMCLKIDKDAEAGTLCGEVRINELTVPYEITVFPVVLPTDTLHCSIGLRCENICSRHHVEPRSKEYDEMLEKYFTILRRGRNNMFFRMPEPVVTDLGDNNYSFDFTDTEAFIKKAVEFGFRGFRIILGRRRSWKESTIYVNNCTLPCMSLEGYKFIRQYLTAYYKLAEKLDAVDKLIVSICDEPNEINAVEYRALAGMVRKIVPKFKTSDATSCSLLYGSVDILVPGISSFEKKKAEFDILRDDGDEIWHYVCCGPRGNGYINRFIDYPLISTLYLHWGNYYYDLPGFLHWACNYFVDGQDPFKQTCPSETNADITQILPPGDGHIIYPGDDGPWMSMRLEAQRVSAEDYELMKLLSRKNKPLADEICTGCFRKFNDVEYDVNVYKATKRRLLEEASRI